jgi:hypothetical protein
MMAMSNREGPDLMELRGLPPGNLQVSVRRNDGRDARLSLPVHLSASSELDARDAPASTIISGLVKMDCGSPPPQRLLLQLKNRPSGETTGISTNADGIISFQNTYTLPGEYDVSLAQQGIFQIRSLSATGAKVTGHTLEIIGGQEVNISLVLAKGSARVHGMAVQDGKPVVGVMVLFVPQDGETEPSFYCRDQTDSDGSIALTGVFPGHYIVVAIDDGWELEWAKPEVLMRYLPGGASAQIAPGENPQIKVIVQQP